MYINASASTPRDGTFSFDYTGGPVVLTRTAEIADGEKDIFCFIWNGGSDGRDNMTAIDRGKLDGEYTNSVMLYLANGGDPDTRIYVYMGEQSSAASGELLPRLRREHAGHAGLPEDLSRLLLQGPVPGRSAVLRRKRQGPAESALRHRPRPQLQLGHPGDKPARRHPRGLQLCGLVHGVRGRRARGHGRGGIRPHGHGEPQPLRPLEGADLLLETSTPSRPGATAPTAWCAGSGPASWTGARCSAPPATAISGSWSGRKTASGARPPAAPSTPAPTCTCSASAGTCTCSTAKSTRSGTAPRSRTWRATGPWWPSRSRPRAGARRSSR